MPTSRIQLRHGSFRPGSEMIAGPASRGELSTRCRNGLTRLSTIPPLEVDCRSPIWCEDPPTSLPFPTTRREDVHCPRQTGTVPRRLTVTAMEIAPPCRIGETVETTASTMTTVVHRNLVKEVPVRCLRLQFRICHHRYGHHQPRMVVGMALTRTMLKKSTMAARRAKYRA